MLHIPKCPGIDFIDKCPREDPRWHVPKLSDENAQVIDFFKKCVPWIFSGMGGYNMNVVKDAFDIYEIPGPVRPLLMDRITILISTHAQVKDAEKDNK